MTQRYVIGRTELKKRVQNSLVGRLYGDSVTKIVTIVPSVAPSNIGVTAKTDESEANVASAGVAEWQTRCRLKNLMSSRAWGFESLRR